MLITNVKIITVGKLNDNTAVDDQKDVVKSNEVLGEEKPNCGVSTDCGPDSFSVQMFTGLENKYLPKICIGGK